jgi:pimeloyl-ACP methyl ester carboxylesterase
VPVLVAGGHRVITYDRRGFCESSKPISGYDQGVDASVLEDTRKAIAADRLAYISHFLTKFYNVAEALP